MERITRAIYSKELPEEAVKLVREGGLGIPEVGRRLSVLYPLRSFNCPVKCCR